MRRHAIALGALLAAPLGPAGPARAAPDEAPPASADVEGRRGAPAAPVWRYRLPGGREGFAPTLDGVPAGATDVAPLDLRDTALNVEVGNALRDAAPIAAGDEAWPRNAAPGGPDRVLAPGEIARAVALERERGALVRSEVCARARAGDIEPLSERLLRDHLHLPVLALVALVLVGLVPSMATRFAAPQWMRLVSFVLPLLGFLAMTTSTLVEAARLQKAVRHAAEACDPGLALGPLDSAHALEARLEVVDALRAYVGERGL